MKIAIKLILAFLVVALLVVIVGYFSALQSQKILEETTKANSLIWANTLIARIDKEIYGMVEKFQMYSKDLILQRVIQESNRDFAELDNVEGYIAEKEKAWRTAWQTYVRDRGKICPCFSRVDRWDQTQEIPNRVY